MLRYWHRSQLTFSSPPPFALESEAFSMQICSNVQIVNLNWRSFSSFSLLFLFFSHAYCCACVCARKCHWWISISNIFMQCYRYKWDEKISFVPFYVKMSFLPKLSNPSFHPHTHTRLTYKKLYLFVDSLCPFFPIVNSKLLLIFNKRFTESSRWKLEDCKVHKNVKYDENYEGFSSEDRCEKFLWGIEFETFR